MNKCRDYESASAAECHAADGEEVELWGALCPACFPHSSALTDTRHERWILYFIFLDRARAKIGHNSCQVLFFPPRLVEKYYVKNLRVLRVRSASPIERERQPNDGKTFGYLGQARRQNANKQSMLLSSSPSVQFSV